MKNTKRILLAAVAALLLVAVSVGGTLAWLTDNTAPVTNTFTTSDINIVLAETTTDYKMVPGATIDKDPKVTVVKGSEACWLFVKVEKSDNLDKFISYNIVADWTQLEDAEGNKVEGVFYRTVGADAVNDQEFYVLAGDNNGQVTVKPEVTKAMMEALKAEGAIQPTLTFTAYAIQQEGFSSAATAWAQVSAPVAP